MGSPSPSERLVSPRVTAVPGHEGRGTPRRRWPLIPLLVGLALDLVATVAVYYGSGGLGVLAAHLLAIALVSAGLVRWLREQPGRSEGRLLGRGGDPTSSPSLA